MKRENGFFCSHDFLHVKQATLDESFASRVADQANRLLLERATRVYAYNLGKCPDSDWRIHNYLERGDGQAPTHTALLIDVREIERDTAESLIDAAIAFVDAQEESNILPKLLRDAKALLAKQAGDK